MNGSEPPKSRRIPDCLAGRDAVAWADSVSVVSTLPNSDIDIDGRLSSPGNEDVLSIGCLKSPYVSLSSDLSRDRSGIGSGSSFFEARFPALLICARRPLRLIELDRGLIFLSSISGDTGPPIGGDLRLDTNSGERV